MIGPFYDKVTQTITQLLSERKTNAAEVLYDFLVTTIDIQEDMDFVNQIRKATNMPGEIDPGTNSLSEENASYLNTVSSSTEFSSWIGSQVATDMAQELGIDPHTHFSISGGSRTSEILMPLWWNFHSKKMLDFTSAYNAINVAVLNFLC